MNWIEISSFTMTVQIIKKRLWKY